MEAVTKAKRLAARMDKGELEELSKYLNERYRLLNRREQDAKDRAKFEKVKNIPIGGRAVVNLKGDREWPRGTIFEIDSHSPRGRVVVKAPNGKRYNLNPHTCGIYDIKPEVEYDPGDEAHSIMIF